MKLGCKLLLAGFCLFTVNMHAQNPSNLEELAQKYSDYFELNREAVFLHLNKTAIVPGESIWFSAYVYSPMFQVPSVSTTNLHVNLYDALGQLQEAKTLFLKNGQASGYFNVDSLPSGKYMIKASTKYMENFREDLSFSQSFTILGEEMDSSVPLEYDLQLLPEGGHLVSNVMNTVGVKLINNSGKGTFFTEGQIFNSKNDVVNTFKSNRYGLSKFSFVPTSDEKYYVVLKPINGNQLRQEIPVSSSIGISLTTNTMVPGAVIFSIKTNPETFESLKGKTFYMALHKDGAINIVGFIIPEETLEANISISKTGLAPGITTMTVFDDKFQPILERMIFNNDGIKRKMVDAKFLRLKADSLAFGLSSKDSLGLHSLSISVLPSGTESYSPKNNIFSAFYIEPYIRGELENGQYYFSEKVEQRRKDYDLDILLLTQGWTKYSWHNVFNNTPKELFKPEQGFILLGGLNQTKDAEESKVLLIADKTNLFEFVDLQNDASFKLEKLFLIDSSAVSVGLVHKKNQKLSKPAMFLSVLPVKDQNSIILSPNFGKKISQPEATKSPIQNTVPENFISDAVSLGTVIVNAELQDKIDTEREEEDFRGHMYFQRFDMDRLSESMLLTSFLRMHGFRVINGRGVNPNLIIKNIRSNRLGGELSPLLIIDEVEQIDYERIKFMTLADIDKIYINSRGAGYGIDGAGGVIKLKLKSGGNSRYNRETMMTMILQNGFADQKEFYAPKYTSYTNDFFDHYGVIDWFPNLFLDETGHATFQILNTLQPTINVYIEGMTSGGALISETINLKTN